MAQKIDISGLSYKELKELKVAIDTALGPKLQKDREIVAAKMREMADSVGLSVREAMKMGAEKRPAGEKVPKFRDPANAENTWSGRGAAPKWVKDYEASGKSRADLRIPGA